MSQQTTAAPDSPAVIVSANVQKYAIKKKKVLSAEETELFELTQSAGVIIDQEVFKIIVDLLKMNVAPQAVFQTLKAMCAGQRVAECGTESPSSANTTGNTTVPTDAREEESLASGKSSKACAAPSAATGSKSTRVNTKIVVYGPQDVNSSHSQGPQVRNKTGASHSEKVREPSTQKIQRQPSANRGQKTKSSGSSSSSSQINST